MITSSQPAVLLLLTALTLLYFLGVRQAWRQAGPGRGIGLGRALSGGLGLAALALALASPIEPLAGALFSAHMAQHLLLALVAAPLLVVASPLLALLWLLPPDARRGLVGWWRRSRRLRIVWHRLSHPLAACSLFVGVLWLWHLPAAYEWALIWEPAHALEHASILATAGLFWWVLLQPVGRRRLSRFGAPLVLFGVAMQGGLLGALITLSPEPWYQHYRRAAEASRHSALADQQLAGLLMWIPPGALYLGLACWLLYQALAGKGAARRAFSGGDRALPRHRYLNGVMVIGVAGALARADAQVTNPAGPAAASIAGLWWLLLAVATLVCLVVYVLLLMSVFRGPRGERHRQAAPPLGSGPFVVVGGIVVPLLILVPLLFYSLGVTAGLVRHDDEALTVEVIGHQWWWEVRYPESGVVSANEIHVPAGRPVRLELTSADVIHSFWAPGLQGKMDLVPGDVNSLWIEAYQPGVFEAKCAEFCGAQHANMRLMVVSEPPESFERWLAERQGPAPTPRDAQARKGQEVFLSSACALCHTVEGTNASGSVGPDLTHVASRLTLGAGTVANNRGNLGGWVVNSQAIKPGNRMPPMYLESAELQALLAYLETLE